MGCIEAPGPHPGLNPSCVSVSPGDSNVQPSLGTTALSCSLSPRPGSTYLEAWRQGVDEKGAKGAFIHLFIHLVFLTEWPVDHLHPKFIYKSDTLASPLP